MPPLLKRVSIGVKLPVIMVILIVASISIVGTMAYTSSLATVRSTTADRLSGIAEGHRLAFEDGLNSMATGVEVLASSPLVQQAMGEFGKSWALFENPGEELQHLYIERNEHPVGEKDKLVSAWTGSLYDHVHSSYHPY